MLKALQFNSQRFIAVVTVYRSKSVNVSIFLQHLQKVIETYCSSHRHVVCLGDFNEDAQSNGPIQNFMESHRMTQMVHFSTTEGGTILDHVYVSNGVRADVNKIPTYYSYHHGLRVSISTN